MNRLDRQKWKTEAAQALEDASCSPRKLMLLYMAVTSGLSLLTVVLNFIISEKIGQTGGLSGIGLRSTLEFVQSILSLVSTVVMPFLAVGLLQVMLHISRRKDAQPRDLLTGFRLFGPVLRTMLLSGLLLMGAGFLGGYGAMLLYSVSPFSAALQEALLPYVTETNVLSGMTAESYEAMLNDSAVMEAMTASMPWMLVGMVAAMIPVYYRIRLMNYVLLDAPQQGAMNALRISRILMRKRGWELFKLDLSFWWFYALELLVTALCYGNMILPMFHVELGMSENTAYFLFYILGLVMQLGLYVWKKPYLMTTYARYYEAVVPKPKEVTPPTVEYTL